MFLHFFADEFCTESEVYICHKMVLGNQLDRPFSV